MKEETLSDKIVMGFIPEDRGLIHENFIWRKDVKEFIQKLKEEIKPLFNSDWVNERIDKIAGDALSYIPQSKTKGTTDNQDYTNNHSPQENPQLVITDGRNTIRERITEDTSAQICECGRIRINHPSESCKKFIPKALKGSKRACTEGCDNQNCANQYSVCKCGHQYRSHYHHGDYCSKCGCGKFISSHNKSCKKSK